MAGSTTNAKPNSLGDFFANAWDILTAETLDEEESVDPWNSRLFAERRNPTETIYYEERDRAPEAPRPKYTKKLSKGSIPKDQMVNQKNYSPDSPSKIDESELPTTIAVVSQSPVLKNRFMAQEYKEIRNNMKTLLEIEEEDLNSVGIDLLAAQAKEQVSDDRPKGKRAEKIKSYAAAREKAIEKKQKSRVSEKEDRKKRSLSRNRMIDSDRTSRSSRSQHKPHSSTQMRRRQTSTRVSQERAAPRSDGHRYNYDKESRDPAVEHYTRYDYHEPDMGHDTRYEYLEPAHHRHVPTRTNMNSKRRYVHDDPELCSYYDSKRSSSASISSTKRFLGFKR